jgi:hypothetical protein
MKALSEDGTFDIDIYMDEKLEHWSLKWIHTLNVFTLCFLHTKCYTAASLVFNSEGRAYKFLNNVKRVEPFRKRLTSTGLELMLILRNVYSPKPPVVVRLRVFIHSKYHQILCSFKTPSPFSYKVPQ